MTDREIISLGKVEAGNSSDSDAIDFGKLLYLLKRSKWFILIFFILGLSASYLITRYSKPLYQSSSLIKLNFKNEANSLGLIAGGAFQNELKGISGEIEILRSNLFLKRVIDVIDYPVSYYYYGTYLVDERYRNNPFVVSFKIKDSNFYDKKFDLNIVDSHTFKLNDGNSVNTYEFGEEILTDQYNLLIEKTKFFDQSVFGKYYFTINSERKLLSHLRQNIKVQPENFNANTIRISFTDYNKYKARDFVTAIDTLYLDYTVENKNKVLEQKIDFLDRQIVATEENLQEYESYFENFIIENRTLSLQSDLSRNIRLLSSLDSQRINTREQLNTIELLQSQISTKNYTELNPFFLRQLPGFITEAIKNYTGLIREREQKITLYNENTFVIKKIDEDIERTNRFLNELISEYIKSLEQKIVDLNQRARYFERNFIQLPSMSTEYNKNKRLYSLQENVWLSFKKSKLDLEISKAGTITDSVILSSASLPTTPIKPQKMLIMAVGFIAAFVISILFVLVRYLLHNKISSTREIEKLTNIPVIGSVPLYTMGPIETSKLVIEYGSKSAISEALRTIRTNMEFLNPIDRTDVISVTSTVSGEGKTFFAVNLGAIIASGKYKVCVVDLDMRKPKVHFAFGDDQNTEGMSTMLIGKSDLKSCIRNTPIENLNYISAGPIPPNPSELILGEEFGRILNKLKAKFDIVVLDTPPVGIVTDGILAMKRSDIQFYVFKSDYSKREYLRTMENIRRINDFHNLAVVLNGVSTGQSDYSYYSSKGDGYYVEKNHKAGYGLKLKRNV